MGAAARLAGALLRGGAAPELAEIGTPGWDSSRLWVGEDPRVMRDPTGHSGEGVRARDAMRGGGGDSAPGRFAGERCPAH